MSRMVFSPPTILRDIVSPEIACKIIIKISTRARRLRLRVEPAWDCIVLVRPRAASDKAVTSFVAKNKDWILDRLNTLPARVPFSEGAVIPFEGNDHVIAIRPASKARVWREGKTICVTSHTGHLHLHVENWLKQEARKRISALVGEMATKFGFGLIRITMKDMRTRWGSCTQDGRLSFSWRLILAPPFVLKYVAAHETAHLMHANHSPAFKRAKLELLKPYSVDPGIARLWLSRYGAGLYRFG